ncbi:uncharacterized protein LOC130815580 [Amaranthus tricolor]|uniref:uncharacterized protein LOC130815580 n=1 Tax=Amaranthus tricolor TaxID=29722 RepID=UPI0025848054|nr:uncharacterized protein LOC130815580 [Amaranthus tricolor]
MPSSIDAPLQIKPKPNPWLLVGLGNPRKKYNATRHNVGFEMVDTIAEAEGISMNSFSFKALFAKGHIGNVPVILFKPQTFMNVSGKSVGPMVSYYKIPLNQVLVIYDDLDLPFAKLRLLPKGGHGGHNGMRSIIDHFKGSRDFPRLRIETVLLPISQSIQHFKMKTPSSSRKTPKSRKQSQPKPLRVVHPPPLLDAAPLTTKETTNTSPKQSTEPTGTKRKISSPKGGSSSKVVKRSKLADPNSAEEGKIMQKLKKSSEYTVTYTVAKFLRIFIVLVHLFSKCF